MFVITAKVKYNPNEDYKRCFLLFNDALESYEWHEYNATFYKTIEEANKEIENICNDDIYLNEYYEDVIDITAQEIGF